MSFDCPIPDVGTICRRDQLVKSCNATAMTISNERHEKGEAIKAAAEQRWREAQEKFAKLNDADQKAADREQQSRQGDTIDFDLNDPSLTLAEKTSRLRERQQQLLAEAAFIERQLKNLEKPRSKS